MLRGLMRVVGPSCLALFAAANFNVAKAYEYLGKEAIDTLVSGDSASYYAGELLVKFDSEVDYDSALSILDSFDIEPYLPRLLSGTIWGTVDLSRNVFLVCDSVEGCPGVSLACPNLLMRPTAPPNDPYFAPLGELVHCDLDNTSSCSLSDCESLYWWQWPLHYHDSLLIQQAVSPNAHIRVVPAWDVTSGDVNTKVLVVDGGLGVDSLGVVAHDDLDPNTIHTGRSYNLGLDTLTGDDVTGHGTATAGVLGASKNNNLGIAGIASGCAITVGQVGSVGSMLYAFHHACSLGVRLINSSYTVGHTGFDTATVQVLEPAVAMLRDSSILLVASFGNSQPTIGFPATFASVGLLPGASGGYDNVISVGKLLCGGLSPDQSNPISRVTLVAPGAGFPSPIPSTSAYCDTLYIGYAGSSAAAPHVSGVAALALSHYGTMSAGELRQILISSADRIWVGVDDSACLGPDFGCASPTDWHDSTWHPHYGHGRVNAFRSLNGWYGAIDSCDTSWETGTLYGDDNRVYIADLTIGAACTLSIDAGIEVRAVTTDVVDGTEVGDANSYPCELIVEGRLVVEGTPGSPVLFSSTNATTLPAWAGIHVKAGGYLSLKNARIENANIAITLDAGATIDTLIGVEFVNCITALNVTNQSVVLSNVVMSGVSQYGFVGDTLSSLIVSGGFEVTGPAADSTLFFPKNSSARPGWKGMRICDSSSLSFDRVVLSMPAIAFDVDSGASVLAFHLKNTLISKPVDYGIYSEFGNGVIRLDSAVTVSGRKDTTIAVFVANATRLVAKHCVFEDGQSGIRANGNGADTIINCHFNNNSLYGMYLWLSDTKDYTKGNVFENDASNGADYGFLAELQSVKSESDIVRGGFNWGFYLARPVRADVTDLVMEAKDGDDWGLYISGPFNDDDTAFVDHAVVTGSYDQAHCYLYRMTSVTVENSDFISSGDNDASPYGVMDYGGGIAVEEDMEPNYGRVACCNILDMKTECVYTRIGSFTNYGDAISLSYGWNNIYITDTSQNVMYFYNHFTSTKKAEQNWWGQNPMTNADSSRRFGGKVDFRPYETDSALCGGEGEGGESRLVAEITVPYEFELKQNYPNPFNASTVIQFSLAQESHVTIEIFNILGQAVRRYDLGTVPAGPRALTWSGRNNSGDPVSSGLYLYRITTPEFTDLKRMLLLK